MRSLNSRSSRACSSGTSSFQRRISIPSDASAGTSMWEKQRALRAESSRASSSAFSRICSAGWPDAFSTGSPVAIRRMRPAIRTPKNSSSPLAKIDENLTRSSSGTFVSSASSRTRSANRSQLFSRSR